MTEKEVKVFSLSTCSHCKSTKKLLSDCTVKYDFVDVDLLEGEERKAILEDVKKFNPKCSFPTVIIGVNAGPPKSSRNLNPAGRTILNEKTMPATNNKKAAGTYFRINLFSVFLSAMPMNFQNW